MPSIRKDWPACNRVRLSRTILGGRLKANISERLRTLLHQSPRNFGKSTSLWTLALAAEVAYAEGLTSE